MFLYGDESVTTIKAVYKNNFEYGLNRRGLDYSLRPYEG